MSVLSVDPGERVGYAIWSEDGTLQENGVLTLNDFIQRFLMVGEFMEAVFDTIVVEQWAFRPGQTGRGDKMLSSQLIGMLKLYAKQTGADIVFQRPEILRVSALHAGVKVPKGHIKDDVSAYLHGHYYFVEKGILTPKDS